MSGGPRSVSCPARAVGGLLWAALLVPGSLPAQPRHITITEAGGVAEVASPGEVSLYSTPVHYQVVGREALAASPASITEVLRRATGAQVQSSGGLGSFSSVSLRGAASEQVLVFLDGVPLNDAAGGGVDLSAFDPAELERVEIYRGATPLELGGASLGGAVNLVTRKAPGARSGQVLLGAGSFATRQAAASWNAAGERDQVLLGANWLASDNDFEIRNDNATAFNPDDDFDEARNNADFEQRNGLFKWRRQLSADTALALSVQGFAKDQGLPDISNSEVNDARLQTDIVRAQGRLDALRLGGTRTGASANLFALRKVERFDDRDSRIGLSAQHTRGTTERFGTDGFVNHILGAVTVRGVLEAYRETFAFEDRLGALADSESRRDALTSGAEYSHYLLDNRLILSGVLRAQWVRDSIEVDRDGSGAAPRAERSDHYSLSPQLGAKYLLDARSHVKANLGRYTRVPAFYELFGDRGLFIGNPDLEPETGVNFDLGVEYVWYAPGRWFHGAVAGAEFFRNRADDLIARVFDARGVGRSENVSDATLEGATLSALLLPAPSWEVAVNATWLETEIASDLGAFDGNRLPGRYARTLNLDLVYVSGGWRLTARRRVLERKFYDTANLLPAADQRVTDLLARFRRGAWRVDVALTNVTDERYEDFNGFPNPGRALFASLARTF